ncbi:hypothetical protein F4804DRAFT_349866 [Jackrogersella minutella]|nr:hypothetical protein F4804DRAFT_349866 [Jackrogersella minutella]
MATTTTSFRKTTLSHAQKTVLAMSRAQYLDAIGAAARPADRLYVGVCIFRMDAHSSRPSILLLRRSCAAAASSSSSGASTVTSTSSIRRRNGYHSTGVREGGRGDRGGSNNGAVWELPGGKVRDADFCISAAVARRVVEQTGLRVVRVLGALQDLRHVNEVRILDWDDDGVGIFAGGDGAIDDDRTSVDSYRNSNGSSGSNLSISMLDGATLTSGTSTTCTESLNGSGGSSIGRGSSNASSTTSRRTPIHNPQLVLRRECLQLNYAVLVQSHEDLSVRSRDHDEMVWASFSRAETLCMPEELRTVVRQGLAFAGEYLF